VERVRGHPIGIPLVWKVSLVGLAHCCLNT
jgi:hypothetical protein